MSTFTVNGGEFARVLKNALIFAEKDPALIAINGVRFEGFEDGVVTVVATDRFRLSWERLALIDDQEPDDDFGFTMWRTDAEQLLQVFPKRGCATVVVTTPDGEGKYAISVEGAAFGFVAVPAEFLPWRRLLAETDDTKAVDSIAFEAGRMAGLGKVKPAGRVSNDQNFFTLTFNGSTKAATASFADGPNVLLMPVRGLNRG